MRAVSSFFSVKPRVKLNENAAAWATRTIIVRKLKGLEDIIRGYTNLVWEFCLLTIYFSCHRCFS
jgi:glutathionyl-hydroquinone reductase